MAHSKGGRRQDPTTGADSARTSKKGSSSSHTHRKRKSRQGTHLKHEDIVQKPVKAAALHNPKAVNRNREPKEKFVLDRRGELEKGSRARTLNKAETAELKRERKFSEDPNLRLLHDCRHDYEEIRRSTPSEGAEPREVIVDRMIEKLVDILPLVSRNHVGARVAEAMLKQATEKQVLIIVEKFLPVLPELAVDKYGHHVAIACFEFTPKDNDMRSAIINAFTGQVHKIGTNAFGSMVLDRMYSGSAPLQQCHLVEELYGKEFQHGNRYRAQKPRTLGTLLAGTGESAVPEAMRKSIIDRLSDTLVKVADSDTAACSLFLRAADNFFRHADNPAQLVDLAEALAPAVMSFIEATLGARVACFVIAFAHRKTRQRLIRQFAEAGPATIANDNQAFVTLCKLMMCDDDTVRLRELAVSPEGLATRLPGILESDETTGAGLRTLLFAFEPMSLKAIMAHQLWMLNDSRFVATRSGQLSLERTGETIRVITGPEGGITKRERLERQRTDKKTRKETNVDAIQDAITGADQAETALADFADKIAREEKAWSERHPDLDIAEARGMMIAASANPTEDRVAAVVGVNEVLSELKGDLPPPPVTFPDRCRKSLEDRLHAAFRVPLAQAMTSYILCEDLDEVFGEDAAEEDVSSSVPLEDDEVEIGDDLEVAEGQEAAPALDVLREDKTDAEVAITTFRPANSDMTPSTLRVANLMQGYLASNLFVRYLAFLMEEQSKAASNPDYERAVGPERLRKVLCSVAGALCLERRVDQKEERAGKRGKKVLGGSVADVKAAIYKPVLSHPFTQRTARFMIQKAPVLAHYVRQILSTDKQLAGEPVCEEISALRLTKEPATEIFTSENRGGFSAATMVFSSAKESLGNFGLSLSDEAGRMREFFSEARSVLSPSDSKGAEVLLKELGEIDNFLEECNRLEDEAKEDVPVGTPTVKTPKHNTGAPLSVTIAALTPGQRTLLNTASEVDSVKDLTVVNLRGLLRSADPGMRTTGFRKADYVNKVNEVIDSIGLDLDNEEVKEALRTEPVVEPIEEPFKTPKIGNKLPPRTPRKPGAAAPPDETIVPPKLMDSPRRLRTATPRRRSSIEAARALKL